MGSIRCGFIYWIGLQMCLWATAVHLGADWKTCGLAEKAFCLAALLVVGIGGVHDVIAKLNGREAP